ncbi:LTA synthase family protein [Peredibacter starrii]|uniref:LTA synthase family protein n=1 Tax=Peredibacter starrii TaxID=28202 RepID=A0AAX4HTT7_9BACT|nr:LTA synthase family protein [Peredibacter starrii]WPU66360.1 LTA synthase family protein [Peredibacter starrii]
MVLTAPQVRLLKRLLFLLIPYSVLRIGFYFYHLNIYKQFTQDEIFQSFLLGVRFDVAAICLLNLPLILLSCFSWIKERTERILFILINTAGFIVTVDDYELFLFTGKRLSYDFFVISDDILQQLPQIFLYYWYLPIAAIAFGIGYYFFDRSYFKATERKVSLPTRVGVGFVLLGLTFIGIRGGLQHKSINVQSAFVQGKNELGHLVLNSPYHFLRTLKNKPMQRLALFKSDDEAKNIILNQRDFRDGIEGKAKSNVVLIILESFASEYMEGGYTPFLNELKTKSHFFGRHLANGRKSIEALPSLLCGLPSLLDEPISKSIYSGNKFNCFPKMLKSVGYTNYFFHAGAKGTMGFDSYTLANGFDRYFSRKDYGEKDYDGTWGIFDGPYLQYVADRISEMPEPFLAGVFTLSSHQPYTIPGEFRGKFPKGNLEIHPSIGYTDYALREFFKRIEKEKWFSNTVFIITSDHSQKLETKKFSNLVGRYRVPLLVYVPGGAGKEYTKVTQHSDIPKTVLDYLEIKSDELPATSVSAFSNDEGAALNYADGSTYFMARKEVVTTLDKSYQQQSFNYDWETGEMHPVESNNPLLKAYLQYFMNGLINNNLSL